MHLFGIWQEKFVVRIFWVILKINREKLKKNQYSCHCDFFTLPIFCAHKKRKIVREKLWSNSPKYDRLWNVSSAHSERQFSNRKWPISHGLAAVSPTFGSFSQGFSFLFVMYIHCSLKIIIFPWILCKELTIRCNIFIANGRS